MKRRLESDRWNAETLKQITATPRCPNPKDIAQNRPMPIRDTLKLDGEIGFEILPKVDVDESTPGKRDFKITKDVLTKFGPTSGCPGCEASTYGMKSGGRAHWPSCRERLEENMRSSDSYEDRLKNRDIRLERAHPAEASHMESDPTVIQPEDEDIVSDEDLDILDFDDDAFIDTEQSNRTKVSKERSPSMDNSDDEGSPKKRQKLRNMRIKGSLNNICKMTSLRSEYGNMSKMLEDL